MWRLRRALTAAAMLLLALMIVFVVAFFSPYYPVIQPYKEIEEIWAIEDAREMSEEPLITRLENNGMPLAYDEEENTFYCTLGLENGSEWPQLHLTAPDAQDVSLCFVDDYAYDSCADAIAEGYSYQLVAYTDELYAYAQIVFTGLPAVSLYTQEKIDKQDVPAKAAIARADEEALVTSARVHAHGRWSYRSTNKKSYEIEFTRRSDGTGRISRTVPSLGETDEILLLAMAGDEMMMRDRLSWEMAERVWPQTESFAPRRMQYAEVFINDAYCGVYLMMTPYDYEQELIAAGNDASDPGSIYRVVTRNFGRPYVADESVVPPGVKPLGYEVRYTNDAEVFAALEPYLEMMKPSCSEEAFDALVRRHIDVDSLLRYALLMQGMVLTDNSRNNMYIWTGQEDGGDRYRFALWDMDMSWDYDAGEQSDYWICNPMIDRVIGLDVDGARGRLAVMWEEMKAAGFTYERVEELANGYAQELSASGAFARDAQRWGKDVYEPDVFRILNVANQRFAVMDGAIGYIAQAEGVIGFLDVGRREERFFVSLSKEIENLFEE